MRTDRFQPSGPPSGGPLRLEFTKVVVPLTLAASFLTGLVTWSFTAGGAYSNQASFNAAAADRMTRIEAAEDKDIKAVQTSTSSSAARLEAALIERIGRLETNVGSRLDALERRGDGRLASILQRADAADKRDEQISEALNALNLRLTRIEATREFINANGPGEAGGGALMPGRLAPGIGGGRR